MGREVSDSDDIFDGSLIFRITNMDDIEFKVYINNGLG
jgi:hypothetical protein